MSFSYSLQLHNRLRPGNIMLKLFLLFCLLTTVFTYDGSPYKQKNAHANEGGFGTAINYRTMRKVVTTTTSSSTHSVPTPTTSTSDPQDMDNDVDSDDVDNEGVDIDNNAVLEVEVEQDGMSHPCMI